MLHKSGTDYLFICSVGKKYHGKKERKKYIQYIENKAGTADMLFDALVLELWALALHIDVCGTICCKIFRNAARQLILRN